LTEPRAISNGRYETIIHNACWHAQETKRTRFVRDGIVASVSRAFPAGRCTAHAGGHRSDRAGHRSDRAGHRSDRAGGHRSDRAGHRSDACTFGFGICATFGRSGGGSRRSSRRSGGDATPGFDHSTGFDFAGTDFDRAATAGCAAPGGNRNAGRSRDHDDAADAGYRDRGAAIR
jgi:hypothetical protein